MCKGNPANCPQHVHTSTMLVPFFHPTQSTNINMVPFDHLLRIFSLSASSSAIRCLSALSSLNCSSSSFSSLLFCKFMDFIESQRSDILVLYLSLATCQHSLNAFCHQHLFITLGSRKKRVSICANFTDVTLASDDNNVDNVPVCKAPCSAE